MKELLLRSVFGTLYVMLIVFCIQMEAAFALILGVFMLLLFSEINRIKQIAIGKTESIFSLVLGLSVLFWAGYSSYTPLILPFLFAVVTALHLIFVFKQRLSYNTFNFPSYLLYITSGIASLMLLPKLCGEYSYLFVLGLFIAIWSNDTFAFVAGKLFGRYKLAPTLSPKKTWEGFFGGIVFAGLAGYFFSQFETTLSPSLWIVLFVVAGIAGTIGDLLQSKMKRLAGLKDSGKVIPGHGGIFDRLDSVIFAAPFITLIVYINQCI